MLDNLKAGWQLGSATRKLVFKDKSLLYYPILAGLVGIAEAVAIFGSMFLAAGSFTTATFPYLAAVGLLAYYLIVSFTSTYLLMAMFIAFRGFAKGKRTGMGEALSQTWPYLGVIIEWSLFSAVVLLVIRLIEGRLGGLSKLVFGLATSVGIALITFFAIPVIMDNKTGPIETVRKSSEFMAGHFGNTFGGFAYSELYSLLFALAGVGLIAAGVVLAVAGVSSSLALPAALAGATVVIAGCLLTLFAILLSYVLSNVFKLIVYEYANSGSLPDGFSEEAVKKAMKQKGSGRAAAQRNPDEVL